MVVDIAFQNPQSWIKGKQQRDMIPFLPSAVGGRRLILFRLKILAQREGEGDENPNRAVTL